MSKRSLSCAAALGLLASLPAVADSKVASLEAPKSGGIDVGYTISFWRIPFGQTNFDAHFTGDGYRTASHFETSGIVSAFWGAIIDASSSGQIAAHRLSPSVYDSFYRRGSSKKERVKVTYGTNGVPATFADPPYNTARFPVTDAQKKDTFDPLSAVTYMLAGLNGSLSKPCDTVVPVFDGRRRYDIQLTYLHDEPVKLDNGLFTGTAHLCQIHYNQIAGFKPKILKEGRSFPPMYGWFAEIPSASAPSGHYEIALKVWAPMTLGTVVVNLDQLKVQGGTDKS